MTLTVWANHRSVHFLLGGHLVTTVPSRLRPEDIAYLTMRYGARPAGPEPAPAALPRTGSGSGSGSGSGGTQTGPLTDPVTGDLADLIESMISRRLNKTADLDRAHGSPRLLGRRAPSATTSDQKRTIPNGTSTSRQSGDQQISLPLPRSAQISALHTTTPPTCSGR
ncbi:hypothetical protein AB0K49_13110 [Streptomyces decoyicus]|uniref:hypothetical protein n=1 Tax=Streptomyces decoyicus TaxID=249567 RepID=UPI00345CC83C